jgi:hypothetical protein
MQRYDEEDETIMQLYFEVRAQCFERFVAFAIMRDPSHDHGLASLTREAQTKLPDESPTWGKAKGQLGSQFSESLAENGDEACLEYFHAFHRKVPNARQCGTTQFFSTCVVHDQETGAITLPEVREPIRHVVEEEEEEDPNLVHVHHEVPHEEPAKEPEKDAKDAKDGKKDGKEKHHHHSAEKEHHKEEKGKKDKHGKDGKHGKGEDGDDGGPVANAPPMIIETAFTDHSKGKPNPPFFQFTKIPIVKDQGFEVDSKFLASHNIPDANGGAIKPGVAIVQWEEKKAGVLVAVVTLHEAEAIRRAV